jgi:hypothetical protein
VNAVDVEVAAQHNARLFVLGQLLKICNERHDMTRHAPAHSNDTT